MPVKSFIIKRFIFRNIFSKMKPLAIFGRNAGVQRSVGKKQTQQLPLMCQCPLSLALCMEVIFLWPTDSSVWLRGPQTKCNKEAARNPSRVLNINNTDVIGQIKRDLEPDGIGSGPHKSLHSRACRKQVRSPSKPLS